MLFFGGNVRILKYRKSRSKLLLKLCAVVKRESYDGYSSCIVTSHLLNPERFYKSKKLGDLVHTAAGLARILENKYHKPKRIIATEYREC